MDPSEQRFHRVSLIVLDEIQARLRQLFKQKWDLKYPENPWDDSSARGMDFLSREENKRTHEVVKSGMLRGNRLSWDGTTLYAALLYSSHKLLARDSHEYSSIDKLREMRNSCYAHLTQAKIPEAEYHNAIDIIKTIFREMGWSLTEIEHIENKNLHVADTQELKTKLNSECPKIDSLLEMVNNLKTTTDLLLEATLDASNEQKSGEKRFKSIENIEYSFEGKLNSCEEKIGPKGKSVESEKTSLPAMKEVVSGSYGIRFGTFKQTSRMTWNLGMFKCVKKLGHGRYGTVYEVISSADEKRYALKKSHFPPDDFEKCMREINFLSHLKSPHIVKYFSHFFDDDDDGKVCIQMELCGDDLRARLEDRDSALKVIRRQAVKILYQLLSGLDHIHSQKVIHRDLRPANIFLNLHCKSRRISVKIGDFGLACFEADKHTSSTGTDPYMAPEQKGNDYGSKVDMYALAVVMFEILKKNFDLDKKSWETHLKDLCRKTQVTPEGFRPFDHVWEQLLMELLARNPDDRPGAKDVLHSFALFLKEDNKEEDTSAPIRSPVEDETLNYPVQPSSAREKKIVEPSHHSLKATTATFKGYKGLFQQSGATGNSIPQKEINLLEERGRSVGFIFGKSYSGLLSYGTSFYLGTSATNHYVMTNYHVIAPFEKLNPGEFAVCVDFKFQNGWPDNFQRQCRVNNVLCSSPKPLDYSILEIDIPINEASPPALGGYIAEVPELYEDLFGIGYAGDTAFKRSNKCVLVDAKLELERKCVEMHLPNIDTYLQDVEPLNESYQTNDLLHGSSGSPLFNKTGNLVIMHRRGVMENPKDPNCKSSLLEQGTSVLKIINHAYEQNGDQVKKVLRDLFPNQFPSNNGSVTAMEI